MFGHFYFVWIASFVFSVGKSAFSRQVKTVASTLQHTHILCDCTAFSLLKSHLFVKKLSVVEVKMPTSSEFVNYLTTGQLKTAVQI